MSGQQFSLKVQNPCSATWDEMKPVGNNRHCLHCNKDVIDFSILSDAAIQNYFSEHGAKGVCGRFRSTQLENIRITLPSYFFYKKIPAWQKYLAIFLICFGSNLFSLELTIASKQGLHAQTTTAVTGKTKTKKKSKKKKKKAIPLISIQVLDDYTFGLIAIEPLNKGIYVPRIEEEINSEHSKKEISNIKNLQVETISSSTGSAGNKKKKARVFHFPKLEAILPSRFKYPRSNNKSSNA